MRVVIERDEPMRRVRVYVFRDTVDGGYAAHLEPDGSLFWANVPDRAVPPPFLTVPEDIFASIIGEGMSLVPESAVMERAWKDAISVRDRLLTIIEKVEL